MMEEAKLSETLKTELVGLADLLLRAGNSSIWDEAKFYIRDAAELVDRLARRL